MIAPDAREWLEPDGLGGYAMGTASTIAERRYHALLMVATTPPTGRMALLQAIEVFVETPAGRYALTSHRYSPGVIHPDGASRIESFSIDPWPRWRFLLEDGTRIDEELFVPRGEARVVLSFRVVDGGAARLELRPLISVREDHALQRENTSAVFDPHLVGRRLVFAPFAGAPALAVRANGRYRHDPHWYRQFLYAEETRRGLDDREDLMAPGVFEFDLSVGEALFSASLEMDNIPDRSVVTVEAPIETQVASLRTAERARRAAFPDALARAGDAYLVRRGTGATLIAGYPWFTDWGRDTFISLRGLMLATGRLDEARAILVEWARFVDRGMLPNRFPDRGAPEYNAVDASLWFVIAAAEWIAAAQTQNAPPPILVTAIGAILDGYAAGTRYGIRLDDDGLLCAGEPGVALTWMDAREGDWVVTPRVGKPVEVQALWLNALDAAARLPGTRGDDYAQLVSRGLASFRARFWNIERETCFDVIDVGGVRGAVDGALRPNQIFAAGGLPLMILDEARARQVVDLVERELWTPMGLRTLAPTENDYAGHYEGDRRARDGAYHQGTAWPWLLGPFVEAWVRVRGATPAAKREARERFFRPLTDGINRMSETGAGHLPEIADGDAPHSPRGCPFQAWSVGEALRLDRVVLAE